MCLCCCRLLFCLSVCLSVCCRIARDPRFERMPCDHKGIYADDCLVRRCQMVCLFFFLLLVVVAVIVVLVMNPILRLRLQLHCTAYHTTSLHKKIFCVGRSLLWFVCCCDLQHKCYTVATCDRDLKRRIRKIPGVPIMFITQRKYAVERFPNLNTSPV